MALMLKLSEIWLSPHIDFFFLGENNHNMIQMSDQAGWGQESFT